MNKPWLSLKARFAALTGIRYPGYYFRPPKLIGSRLTLKRLVNFYVVMFQRAFGHTRLYGSPFHLAFESTNVCNLECPHCFTGAGKVGRKRGFSSPELFGRLLDEIGDRLFLVELYGWGEPLLNKDILDMVKNASSRGIATVMNTNFSIPFDAARAEQLVSSGLSYLGVSIEGTDQENYEKYRVRGDFNLVLENCRLLNNAKAKLNSATPQMNWEFHVFEHNVDRIDQAKAMAEELGMQFNIAKGWLDGPEWDVGGEHAFFTTPTPGHCQYLWQEARVNSDGGVSVCCASFYREDDVGQLAIGADELGEQKFGVIWNNERYQEARRTYRTRNGSDLAKSSICSECPYTVAWESYKGHVREGGSPYSFETGFTVNDWFQWYFNRRSREGDLVQIDLQPVQTRGNAASRTDG